jgi:hypothetical protein
MFPPRFASPAPASPDASRGGGQSEVVGAVDVWNLKFGHWRLFDIWDLVLEISLFFFKKALAVFERMGYIASFAESQGVRSRA